MLSEAQRVQFVENSLDHFFEVVEQDGLTEKFHGLFTQFGIGELFDYSFDRSTYRAVPVTDGHIDALSVIDAGKVPVVLLYPNEPVDITTGLHPLQTKPLETSVISKRSVINPDEHAGASLYAPVGVEELDGKTIVHRGGPLIAYNYDPRLKKQGRTCASIVAHESTHLAQLLAHEPRRYDNQLTFESNHARDVLVEELQAYAVQASMWNRAVLVDVEPMMGVDMAVSVDAIRRSVQGDSFVASPAVIRALREDETARKMLPPALARAA